MYQVITNTEELTNHCKKIVDSNTSFVAIDTEFARNRDRYHPKLCLIQIAYDNEIIIIDSLSKDICLAPLSTVLFNDSIIKTFHDLRQDIEALLTVYHKVPYPLFDTQLAAMMCKNYQYKIGYAALVQELIGQEINKDMKRSDWELRPISTQQLQYAAQDVLFLKDIHQILINKLTEINRSSWLMEEIDTYYQSELHYKVKSNEAWKKIQNCNDLKGKEISLLKILAKKREEIAKHNNICKQVLISDQSLLKAITSLNLHQNIHVAQNTLTKFKNDFLVSHHDLIQSHIIDTNTHDPKAMGHNMKTSNNKLISVIISSIIKDLCQEKQISEKLVASNKDIENFLFKEDNKLCRGWRHELIGKKLEHIFHQKKRVNLNINIDEDFNSKIEEYS